MPGPVNVADFTKRVLLTAMVIALALLLWAVRDAVMLGFAAVLVAMAIHGVADGIEKVAKLPRIVALSLGALVLVGALVGVLWLFGAQLTDELTMVFERLPEAWARTSEQLEAHPIGAALNAEIERMMGGEGGVSFASTLARAGSFTLPFASGVTTAILVIFAAAFLTVSPGAYRSGALLLLPKGVDEKIGGALDDSGRALKKWLLGTLIDMTIIAILMGVTLWALGVPAFVGLALIAGFSQFVPTVGPVIAAVPAILLAFTVSPITALWTAIAYFAVSQVEANIIYPIIQKNTAAIPPALNLVAILAFGMLLGPLGVLLATPMLVVLMVFVVRLYVRDALGKEAGAPGD